MIGYLGIGSFCPSPDPAETPDAAYAFVAEEDTILKCPIYKNGRLFQELIIKLFDIPHTMSQKEYQEKRAKSGGGIGRESLQPEQ
ncbi:MAG: hypothetical protein AVO38_01800 [delta proteobacterium ML8_D]|nr:MAG: hypothetical protein AVO38_01800 [delta proteobacterium ML8_D]